MRIPYVILLTVILLSLCSDVYIYRYLCQRFRNVLWRRMQMWSSLLCYLLVIIAVCLPRRDGDNSMLLFVMWVLYAFFTVYIPKYIFVIFSLLARIPTLFGLRKLRFLNGLGVILAVFTFFALWWGALINRFNIQTRTVEICREDVPADFDGYRIVQISDLHTGTFGDDSSFIHKLADEINALQPDLIVFTGDIVNSRSEELAPHVEALSRLKAKDGVWSILGNHDYGDYANWPSVESKAENLENLKKLQASMGWKMLNNESVMLHQGTDSIALIGVENIGDPPFKVYGSLEKAYPHLSDETFKILLSHNPAHWTDSIQNMDDVNIPLTLSGHTHAMQMEVGGLSPAALRYRTWGGLYSDADSAHLLYVNIGAGAVGFPARIGATPEVSVIVLRHKEK